jgi:hypothetical protein
MQKLLTLSSEDIRAQMPTKQQVDEDGIGIHAELVEKMGAKSQFLMQRRKDQKDKVQPLKKDSLKTFKETS